jgi:hypothetical protein
MFWAFLLDLASVCTTRISEPWEVIDGCGFDYVHTLRCVVSLFESYDDVDSWLEGPMWAREENDYGKN